MTDPLVVVGAGGQPYREYAFASLACRYEVFAVLPTPPTWQQRYLAAAVVADLAEPAAVASAVASVTADPAALLTWDETVLEVTAQAAGGLGRRHLSAAAAARCRDKFATRAGLAAAGLPAVRHRLVHTTEEAVGAAGALGFPVVLKPRALAGSMGVSLVADVAQVPAAFEVASGARYGTLPTGHGVLVEEYLDGPEISVDSAVLDGEVRCVHVARKRLGFPPWFEEVGHLVADWSAEPWAGEMTELVTAAHRALGVDQGITHAELRLTARGPRLVELNGRLGGDLIPYASEMVTGIDLVGVAAELAYGRMPDLTPTREGTAEIRFLYPAADCVVERVDVSAAAEVAGIAHAAALAGPGDRLLLPPRQAIPRLAALVAVGADQRECAEALEIAEKAVDVRVTPTGTA